MDSQGNVYATDYGSNNKIVKFDKNGIFITEYGKTGRGEGYFMNPSDVSIDSLQNIFVVDSGNDRIQKFNKDGNFVMSFGSRGSGDGEFDSPTELKIDDKDNMYVVDTGNHRIQVFDRDATL